MDEKNIQIFEDKKIRTAWNEEEEEWYFSVVDVVGVYESDIVAIEGIRENADTLFCEEQLFHSCHLLFTILS